MSRPPVRPHAQDQAAVAEALGAGGGARRRHQQDRLPDRAAQAAGAAGRAAPAQPYRRGGRLRPYARARHEGRRRGRSADGRGGAAPGHRPRRALGQAAARAGDGLDVGRPAGERTDVGVGRRRGLDRRRRRHRARARRRQPAFRAPRPRRAAFAADRLCLDGVDRHPRPARHAGRAASASTCT